MRKSTPERSKKTGKPIKKSPHVGLSPEAQKLQELAVQSIREKCEAGNVANFAALCREYKLSAPMVRGRMIREDWSTPKRIIQRREQILIEANSNPENCIFRADGPTTTDTKALESLLTEGVEILIKYTSNPYGKTNGKRTETNKNEPRKPERITEGPKKLSGSKSFKMSSLGDGKIETSGNNDMLIGDSGNVGTSGTSVLPSESSPNESEKVSSREVVSASKSTPYALSAEACADHDKMIAELARESLKTVYKLKKLPINKLSDLRILDDLHRRATGRKLGEGSGGGGALVSVNFLGNIGAGEKPERLENVRDDSSSITIPVEAEPVT